MTFEVFAAKVLKEHGYCLEVRRVKSTTVKSQGTVQDEWINVHMRGATPLYERGQIEAIANMVECEGLRITVSYSSGNGGPG